MTDFGRIFKGTNFMTPEVIRYGRGSKDGPTASVAYYELSTGRGLTNEPIWGVTVRDAHGKRFDPDPSKMFFSLAEAEAFILTL